MISSLSPDHASDASARLCGAPVVLGLESSHKCEEYLFVELKLLQGLNVVHSSTATQRTSISYSEMSLLGTIVNGLLHRRSRSTLFKSMRCSTCHHARVTVSPSCDAKYKHLKQPRLALGKIGQWQCSRSTEAESRH